MTELTRDDLVVAKRPGDQLFLAGSPRMDLSFAGLSEKTLFFTHDTVDAELKRLKIPRDSVELQPAKLSAQVG